MAKRKSRGLSKRYDHSYKTKDKGSGKRALNFSSDTKFYKMEEGRNKLIIIPYVIKTKNHPLVKSGDAEIGELDYKLDYYVHKRIGPRNDSFVCLSETYGKRCPICEKQKEYPRDSEEYAALKAKRRATYNVLDMRDEKQEIKVFDETHYYFEKELLEEARSEARDENILGFADPDTPYIINVRATGEKYNGGAYFKYKSFKFIESDIDVDSLIDEAVSLDECINILSYEEITALIEGFDSDEEDDEEETPKRKRQTTKKEVEEDDDEDESEEEVKETKSEKRRKKVQKESECPHGHVFGEDCEEFDECDKCKKWEECEEANEKLNS